MTQQCGSHFERLKCGAVYYAVQGGDENKG